MMRSATLRTLYCTVLYVGVFHCIIYLLYLACTNAYYTVLYCIWRLPLHTVLYLDVTCILILYCTVKYLDVYNCLLYCTVLNDIQACTTSYFTDANFSYCTVQVCTTSYCTTANCTLMYYIQACITYYCTNATVVCDCTELYCLGVQHCCASARCKQAGVCDCTELYCLGVYHCCASARCKQAGVCDWTISKFLFNIYFLVSINLDVFILKELQHILKILY